ncbi:MAG: hypothetical protein GXY17_04570 [Clostridiaceae bacterium]|nr:hypothetical protein [Clostridiaceae bacterium]
MDKELLVERDILYSTDNSFELGCVNVKIFGPNNNNKIPLVIEEKTTNSPLKHIATITKIIQSDIFGRISIDIKKDCDVYIRVNEEMSKEFGNHSYVRVSWIDENISAEGVDW